MATFFDFFSNNFAPLLGGRSYKEWESQSLKLQNVSIQNKKLAKEFEEECIKLDGLLTYSEYLKIDQFGENGYHKTHSAHGFTSSYKLSAPSAFQYIQIHDIHTVFELGPGNGNFAIELCKIAREKKYILTWHGSEISSDFRIKITQRFHKENLYNFLGSIIESPYNFPEIDKALIVSSYCMDSIPPEILTNTSSRINSPQAFIGIDVKNNTITERILTPDQCKKKGISISDSIITYKEQKYDTANIALAPFQRIYLTLGSFNLLASTVDKIKYPHILIVDEFRSMSNLYRTDHLLTPLTLYTKSRHHFVPQKSYMRAGKMLFYYPIYLSMIISVLQSVGISNIEYGEEKFQLKKMLGESSIQQNSMGPCFAIFGSGKTKPKSIISLAPPQTPT
ncbi:MAG: hypothetical protein KA035_02605 [Candidatus Levybacteria bacterium]|nr:hypothetical protein [Candidatus Levybacteria bacterium]